MHPVLAVAQANASTTAIAVSTTAIAHAAIACTIARFAVSDLLHRGTPQKPPLL